MPFPPLSFVALLLSSFAGYSVARLVLAVVDVVHGLVLELVGVGFAVGLAVGGIGLVVTVGSSSFVLLPSSVS